MAPSRVTDEQRQLIENLMEENERLHTQIDMLEYSHKTMKIKFLNSIGNCFQIGERNFKVSMILSILLIIETIYILWWT